MNMSEHILIYTEEEFEYMKYNYLPILDKLGL